MESGLADMVSKRDSPIMYDLLMLYHVCKARGENAKNIVIDMLIRYMKLLDKDKYIHWLPVLIYANAYIFGIKFKKGNVSMEEVRKLCPKLEKKILQLD
jgi:hypothetical protein